MATAALHRRSTKLAAYGARIAAAVIVGSGKVVGFAGRLSPTAVNLGGAAMASYGVSLAYKPAGVILGGLFLLAMGRQLEKRTPRAGNGRGG